MTQVSAEKISQNLEKFYKFIEDYIPDDRGKKLKAFYKSIEETLATSPASSRLSHHNCFPGGYLDHVLRVIEGALIMHKVWERFGQKPSYTLEELVFSAINHDLGKLGTNDRPFYKPNDNQWQVEKQGIMYSFDAEQHMRIADRSLFTLQQAGISMSEVEYISIKIHDGLYEEANKPYLLTFSPEAHLKTMLPHVLHQADLMASQIEKQYT
jgi:hypothetical protein